MPLPVRDESGFLVFADAPRFRPNLTPAEILQAGSFGGTYFRPIYSVVIGNVRSQTMTWHTFSSRPEPIGAAALQTRTFLIDCALARVVHTSTFASRAELQQVKGHWRDLPTDWIKGLNVGRQVASPTYRPGVNRYGVKCGQDLKAWHDQGWIRAQDPAGWFHWYCRFYQGRRSEVRSTVTARKLLCVCYVRCRGFDTPTLCGVPWIRLLYAG